MSLNMKLLVGGFILLAVVGIAILFLTGSSGEGSSNSGASVAVWVAIFTPIWVAIAHHKRKESQGN